MRGEENRTLIHCWLGCKKVQPHLDNYTGKMEIYPLKDLYMDFSQQIFYSQNLETSQIVYQQVNG